MNSAQNSTNCFERPQVCEAATTPNGAVPGILGVRFPAVTLFRMDINQIAFELKAQRNRIDQAIAALEGSKFQVRPRRGRPPKTQSLQPAPGKRTMSVAARKRISAAMTLRWAEWKGKSAPKKTAATAKKSRRTMSPATRKKLAALMKARWAARKSAANGGKA